MNTNELTRHAHQRLMHQLRDIYKTNPTEAESKALHCLLDHYTELASGARTGRYAWGMPCGSAKTQSVVFGCAELFKRLPGFSVAIAVSTVTSAKTLKADMVAAGVPKTSIGILSPKEEDSGEASIFAGDPYPIVIVTHARIHMGSSEVPRYWLYNGHPRAFLIHDESLVASHAVTLDIDKFEEGLVLLKHKVQQGTFQTSYGRALITFLDWQWSSLQNTFAKIRYTLSQHGPDFEETDDNDAHRQSMCRLDNLTTVPEDVTLDTIKDDLSKCSWDGADAIARFLDLCGSSVRCIISKPKLDKTSGTTQRHHLISYTVTVPEEITNMVILDASAPIRHLASMDKTTITLAEDLPSVKAAGITSLATIKNYSQVTLYRYNAGAGYSTMQKDKGNLKIKDAVRLLTTHIPKQEAVLFFTFPQRNVQKDRELVAELRKELIKQGHTNLDGLYGNDPRNPKAKIIEISTWGRETSVCSFQHCSHVILLGTPHQNPLTIRSNIHGQWRDITTPVTDEVLKDALLTEIVYRMHQALGRGTCRQNDSNGNARTMSGYYFHTDRSLETELTKVIPGVKLVNPVEKSNQKSRPGELLEAAIINHLKSLITDHGLLTTKCDSFRTSITALKGTLRRIQAHANTWTPAIDAAIKVSAGWSRVGRSVVYQPVNIGSE